MAYSISAQESQDGLTKLLRDKFTTPYGIPVIEDAMPDDDNETIKHYATGQVRPFIVLSFHAPRRARRGRSFATARLDERVAMADIICVARSGTESRKLFNEVMDFIVDEKPITERGGRIIEAERQLWSKPSEIDMASKPSRWAMPYSVEWGLTPSVTP